VPARTEANLHETIVARPEAKVEEDFSGRQQHGRDQRKTAVDLNLVPQVPLFALAALPFLFLQKP
jgi:hypothetical protein